MSVQKLLFEMSNPNRLEILQELKERSMKLSDIARSLDNHVSETSRHLQRLRELGLVQKEGEGHTD